MEFTNKGIASYVRDFDEDPDLPIPTASLLDKHGDLYLAGDLHTNEVFATSDQREKHNIRTLEDAVENLKKIRGVRFEWNNNNIPGIGVVAQEIQAIYPELTKEVIKFDGEPRLTVNYDGLVGVLIEAVKSLSQRVEELENKLSNNENR